MPIPTSDSERDDGQNSGFPVFQISVGGGNWRTSGSERGLHCGRVANWQLFGPLLAPSRINRPRKIPVQTAAEKWTTQDYRCVQRKSAKFGPPTEHPCHFTVQTPSRKPSTHPPASSECLPANANLGRLGREFATPSSPQSGGASNGGLATLP